MHRGQAARALAVRVVLAVAAAVPLVAAAPGTAAALEVHHLFPQDGSVLATAPDHVEIMFDEELRPGLVQVGVSPDATDRPVPLPGPVVQDNVAIQPLPPLADGPYTAGFRLLGADGHVYQGTFHFRVDAAAAAVEENRPASSTWLVRLVSAGLVVPAAALVLRRRRRTAARR
jgi:methionine-rich copper-binding protein CopC